MGKCGIAGRWAVIVMTVALLASSAMAVTRASMRVKVLDSQTHSVTIEGGDVPKNCDGVNYDAYCRNSKTVLTTNTLLLQEGEAPAVQVTCTVDSKWSRCVALPKGQSFEARREKHGITLYYVDDAGKARSQLYTLVDSGTKFSSPASNSTVANQTSAPASGDETSSENVRCSFSSNPAGAEVTLDGRYIGSTPSVVAVRTGPHVVLIALPGFATWKRELAVSSGSDLTVNAVLQKSQ